MSLKRKAALSLVWTFTQQFGNQIIGFVVSLILARILLPAEFGLIGMIAVVVAVGNALLDGGLTKSLIRDANCDESDYSTVFFFNLFSFLWFMLWFLSLLLLLPISMNSRFWLISFGFIVLTIIITSFSAVQLARLTKKMDFKTQAFIAIPSAVVGGIVGVWMAYNGYGVWSLVWSSIIASVVSTIQMWIYSGWTPTFNF